MDSNKETKKELILNLEKLKTEINSINRELNKINDVKESSFRKKYILSRDIRKNIAYIKESRRKRDSLTKKVKELKEKRNKLNEDIKKKISEAVRLNEGAKRLGKKLKIFDPQGLKGDIDRIETKLETEAMPFEKEKEISKKLKALKKSLEDASVILAINDKVKKLRHEINDSKKKSNETHNEIQKLATESQTLHERLIKSSKAIDGFKAEEQSIYKKFADSKKSFNEINDKLQEKLNKINDIRLRINKFKLEEDEKRKLEDNMVIKGKEQEIEEKIKSGKKLTTDDFFMFQEALKGKKI